ncbi:Lysosome-associated membrane glycoprotein 1 [Orchesella cincta]|uniref:Lysosome-associated membrane glycoprotein 5 n=1 Tax=Orchesella cincta TaxID=48709 RepID=A0A1D2N1M3_ORCCI|nr:Lysosome-associated membrane glycoprotein 1 [Orchesella cincta]
MQCQPLHFRFDDLKNKFYARLNYHSLFVPWMHILMAEKVTCGKMLLLCAAVLFCLHAVGAANETTTVAPVPTPTPAPAPVYPDNTGSWNVTEGNATCVLIRAGIRLNVNYTDINNNTRKTPIDIPSSAVAIGSCNDSSEQYIRLAWYYSESHALNNTLTIVFQANATNKNESGILSANPVPLGKFAIIKVSAMLNKDEKLFPNATDAGNPFTIDQQNLVVLPTSLNHSFACASEVVVGSTSQQLSLKLQNSQIEAFKTGPGKSEDFSTAEHCAADEISSGSMIGTIVITILIIVLLALGAAALVTYVLKKRRATASGYENM